MIKTLWIKNDNSRTEGGEEQISQWQAREDGVLWIDINSESQAREKQLLLELGCHPLAIDDVQRPRHPPKAETFQEQVMILYRGISQFDEELNVEQLSISMFAAERCLITVRAGQAQDIEHYWTHTDNELLRHSGRLALAIMHFSVGRYLEAILAFEGRIIELEDAMQEHPNDDVMRALILYKSRLRKLRRVFRYHERVADSLLRETPELFTQQVADIHHNLQDLFDRTERVHSLATMYYEIAGDLIQGYLSITSHRLNNTIRVLTVITAIFAPLTFIAGVYGMNFENMPELAWHYAYFIVLGLMLTLGGGLLILFKRIRWL